MNTIELLATGIRLVGIYTIIIALQTIGQHINTLENITLLTQQQAPSLAVYMVYIHVAVLFIAAAVLIKFPLTIAQTLSVTPHSAAPVGGIKTQELNAQELHAALACLLGLYVLSQALPDVVDNVLWLWALYQQDFLPAQDRQDAIIILITTLVEIGIGFYLCLKAQGLTRLLWRLREG